MARKLLVWGAAGVAAAAVALYGCANMMLPAVPLKIDGPEARPPVLGAFEGDPPVETASDWTERRAPQLIEAFEKNVYGRMAARVDPVTVQRDTIAEDAFGGLATVEQITVALGWEKDAPRFRMTLVIPNAGEGPHPGIIMQNFCGNAAAFRGMEGVSSLGGVPDFCTGARADFVARQIFGQYISAPPFEMILERGYGLAIFYAGDAFPDTPEAGLEALRRFEPDVPEDERWGTIAAWAWLYIRAMDVLDFDFRFDHKRMAIWGHSRNAKSALLAAAYDKRFAAVIAHQSGTGGATLSRSYAGESVAKITEDYPHWFAPAYAAYAGAEEDIPVDQHQLLALDAPVPVFLGNGRRDKWSDPEGAFRAAMGADPVYELLGSQGLTRTTMQDADLSADIAFFLRPGRHGVREMDWQAFLDFLDAHMPPGPPSP